MTIRKKICFLLSLLLVLSLCACGGKTSPDAADNQRDAAASSACTVTDMVGREVTVVPGTYQRVVCVGAGALRMYCYVGDTALLCGVEDIDNLTLEDRPKMFDSVARPYVLVNSDIFSALPSCGVGGPNAQTAEAEKILSCAPDIVISEYEDAEKANALETQLGVPVITLKSGPRGVFDDSFFTSLNLLATIFGKEERAAELVEFVQSEAAELSRRTADIAESDKPAVYICGLGNWGTTNHLLTSENYAPFGVANVKNVVSGIGTPGNFPLDEEKFVSLGESMDIIIMDAAAVKNIKPLLAEDPTLLDSCRAWREGEVYLQMAFNAYYTNYELTLANTWFIAKTVYPTRFSDIDLTEKMNEITGIFLGASVAEEIFACPSSFGGYQRVDTAAFFG